MNIESKIQVPIGLLCNKKFNHKTVYLYIVLKMSCNNNITNIYPKTLLSKLCWKDNETLKKYLSILKEAKYIEYEFDALPRRNPMIIKIRRLNYSKKTDKEHKDLFFEISVSVIKKIIDTTQSVYSKKHDKNVNLSEQAIRLCYYYKSKYMSDYGYSSPSYAEINNDIGIRYEDIKFINSVLKKNKIIELYVGNWMIDDYGNKIRERNKYTLLE